MLHQKGRNYDSKIKHFLIIVFDQSTDYFTIFLSYRKINKRIKFISWILTEKKVSENAEVLDKVSFLSNE